MADGQAAFFQAEAADPFCTACDKVFRLFKAKGRLDIPHGDRIAQPCKGCFPIGFGKGTKDQTGGFDLHL